MGDFKGHFDTHNAKKKLDELHKKLKVEPERDAYEAPAISSIM